MLWSGDNTGGTTGVCVCVWRESKQCSACLSLHHPGISPQKPLPGGHPEEQTGQELPLAGRSRPDLLTLGWPETLRRMSISLAVASRSSCTSLGEMFPAVMSMIFTAYSCLVVLWMHLRTTLLTPLPGTTGREKGGFHPCLPSHRHLAWLGFSCTSGSCSVTLSRWDRRF